MPLYEVNLPDDVYRGGRIQRNYRNIVRQRRAVVEASSLAAAFTTLLKGQRHPDRAKLTGLIFYGDLKDNLQDYVKPAPLDAIPTFSFQNTDGDRAEISQQARQVARVLSDKPLTPEEETRRAGIVQATSDYVMRQRAKGIFTPEQEAEAQRLKINAIRARRAERGPRRDLYPTKNVEKSKPVEPKPSPPKKPIQGTFWDLRPREYLGESLDTSG